MSYHKREIAHWNQGKGCKGTRKAKERAFVERDVQEQLAEQDENFRYRYYAHQVNREAKLNHLIDWYEQRIAEHERNGKDHWTSAWANYARDGLKKAKKQLSELQEKKNAKVRS